MRHGEYDGSGSLTDIGRSDVMESGREIGSKLGKDSVRIFHSPLVRAVESAEVLAKALDPIRAELVPRYELESGSYGVSDVVGDMDSDDIIVSHMPDLEDFTSELGRYRGFRTAGFHKVDVR